MGLLARQRVSVAMTVDGTPVAAKYGMTAKAAVADIQKRTAKELPTKVMSSSPRWKDVGPIVRIARSSGTIQTTGGETVGTVRAQADETVQGVRLEIVHYMLEQ